MIRHALILSALTLTACAGQRASSGMGLPSRSQLEEIASAPAPSVTFPESPPIPEDWKFHAPAAEVIGPREHPQDTLWEKLFLDTLAQKEGGTWPAGELQCVAREAGVFALEKHTLPPLELIELIGGRCGSTSGAVRLYWLQGELPKGASEEEVFGRWSENLQHGIDAMLQTGAKQAGIWFGRQGERAIVLIAYATPKARILPLPAIPDSQGGFSVRGEVLEPAEQIQAHINRGDLGYAACEADSAVTAPAFSFRCTGEATDTAAWIELTIRPPKRFLGHAVARILVSPNGTPITEFRRTRYSSAVAPDAAFADAFLNLVNDMRARSSQAPLQLDPRQSETAQRVAPHFFSADRNNTGGVEMTDLIAQGLIAGWDIEGGMIRFGMFTSNEVRGTREVSDLVTNILAYPSGRAVLLDPDARRIAIGQLPTGREDVLASLVTTYAFLQPKALIDESREVLTALNEARSSRGLPPVEWLGTPDQAEAKCAQLLEKGDTPDDALNYLLRRVVDATQQPTQGWTLRTSSLNRLEFPMELLLAPKLRVIVSVGYYKDPRDPWGSYVVMLAAPGLQQKVPTTVAARR